MPGICQHPRQVAIHLFNAPIEVRRSPSPQTSFRLKAGLFILNERAPAGMAPQPSVQQEQQQKRENDLCLPLDRRGQALAFVM
jgi:hypothetical protein